MAMENGGDGKIDAAFLQSEEHCPNSRHYSSAIDDVSIPVIDLQRSSPQEVEKACREWGFFYLINHGLPTPILRRMESAANDFFSLPLQEKRKVSRDAQSPLGYFDSELTKNVRDWKEIFEFAPQEPIIFPAYCNSDGHVSEPITNRWPSPEFRDACLTYAEAKMELSVKLIELIARSLGLADNRLNEYFRNGMNFVRLNCYPACSTPELALGLGRHTDGGGIVVLYQDQVGGLEVRRKDNGQWLPVQPLPDSFVVNVGDCMQVWSNDRYESVEHRAVVNNSRRRLSFGLSYNPSLDVMMKPLEELVSEEDPPKYKEYNYGKFYKQRKDSNYKNLGVENLQIYHLRV